jgi:hypothetical protein
MSAPNPECNVCGGSGMVQGPPDPPHPPSFDRCECALRKDILANVERGYPGLSVAPVIEKSPLLGQHAANVWVTTGQTFFSHLRHVAVRQPATWSFKVISDAELVTAWLATAGLGSGEIIDPDAYRVSTKYMTIPDLVSPPDLVVIRMGIKVARNVAAPEVLAEAINTRLHDRKPTWVWDSKASPLDAGSLFWSTEVASILSSFHRLGVTGNGGMPPGNSKTPTKKAPSKSGGMKGKKTLRGGGE